MTEIQTAPGLTIMARQPTDRELEEAIKIRASECYGAMRMANSLGGSESPVWILLNTFSFEELLTEARGRNMKPENWKIAVGEGLIQDAAYFIVAQWNLKYPPGTPVLYRATLGNRVERGRTAGRAYVMKHHGEPAVQLRTNGCSYPLSNLEPWFDDNPAASFCSSDPV